MDQTVAKPSKWSIFQYLPVFIQKPLQFVRWMGGLFSNTFKRPFVAQIRSDGAGGNEFKLKTYTEGTQPETDVTAPIVTNSFKLEREFCETAELVECTENIVDRASGKENNLPPGKIDGSFNTILKNNAKCKNSTFTFTRE